MMCKREKSGKQEGQSNKKKFLLIGDQSGRRKVSDRCWKVYFEEKGFIFVLRHSNVEYFKHTKNRSFGTSQKKLSEIFQSVSE